MKKFLRKWVLILCFFFLFSIFLSSCTLLLEAGWLCASAHAHSVGRCGCVAALASALDVCWAYRRLACDELHKENLICFNSRLYFYLRKKIFLLFRDFVVGALELMAEDGESFTGGSS